MRIAFYIFLGFVMVLGACKQENSTEIPLKFSDHTYSIIEKGDGQKGEAGDFTVFSLKITGEDGKMLLDRSEESNYAKFKIPADTSIFRKGSPIDELLSILVEGDSAVLVYELDSIEQLNPAVMGMKSLNYEIRIKEVIDQAEVDSRNAEEQVKKQALIADAGKKKEVVASRLSELLDSYKAGTLGDKLLSTESGLQYVVEKQGEGAKPTSGENCQVHYYGILESNGEMFDNSYQRGDLFAFPVGQGRVIKGWDEALLLMNKGTEAVFFIPYDLAYGAAGRPPQIPEKSMLVFYIEYP